MNSFLAQGGRGEFDKNFPKIQMPGGCPRNGGMLKLRFDWYIMKTGINFVKVLKQHFYQKNRIIVNLMGDKMVFSATKDSPKYINTEHQDRVQEHNYLRRQCSLTVSHDLTSGRFCHLKIFRPVCKILKIKC